MKVAGRTFPAGVRTGAPKTLLTYVAAQYHLRVESLYYGSTDKDDWGYSPRTPGSTSNHKSATAIDVNATTNPQGASHSHTYAQEQTIRAILRECSGQVRWGRDFRTRPDPMHFDLAPGTTLTSTAAAARKLTSPVWWKRDLYLTGTDPKRWLRGEDVRFVQYRLGFRGDAMDGVFGPATAGAFKQLEGRLLLTKTGKVTKGRAFFVGVRVAP
jgi:hypothetical protein